MHYHEINYVWILNDNQLHKREIPYQDVTKKPASDFLTNKKLVTTAVLVVNQATKITYYRG